MRVRFVDHYIFVDDAEFEAKHKRDEDGKFASVDGVKNTNKWPSKNEQKREHKAKTIEEFYEEEIKGRGLTGRQAMQKLVELQRGHIKAAFHRDDIGDIDLVWGDTRAGLCHTIYERLNKNQDVQPVINGISNAIANGVRDTKLEDRQNCVLVYGSMRVVISKSFKNDGKVRLMVTAYEPNNEKASK